MNLIDALFIFWIAILCIGCFYLGRADYFENHVGSTGGNKKKDKMYTQGNNAIYAALALMIATLLSMLIKGDFSNIPYLQIIAITIVAVIISEKTGNLFEQGISVIRKF